jgi:hypothetical protein
MGEFLSLFYLCTNSHLNLAAQHLSLRPLAGNEVSYRMFP